MSIETDLSKLKKILNDGKLCLCPVKGIIGVLSKKWTLLIIIIIANNPKIRFNEIMGQFEGINPKILSDRLKELEEADLISRKAFPEVPLRVEYSLSKDGKELINALMPLIEWATKKDTQ